MCKFSRLPWIQSSKLLHAIYTLNDHHFLQSNMICKYDTNEWKSDRPLRRLAEYERKWRRGKKQKKNIVGKNAWKIYKFIKFRADDSSGRQNYSHLFYRIGQINETEFIVKVTQTHNRNDKTQHKVHNQVAIWADWVENIEWHNQPKTWQSHLINAWNWTLRLVF